MPETKNVVVFNQKAALSLTDYAIKHKTDKWGEHYYASTSFTK